MSNPHVIEYLRTHSFQQLEEDHGVTARPDKDITKFSLNYNQLYAKSDDVVANQCRGLIVRPNIQLGSDWKSIVVGESHVVAWPFNRFFNHGDPAADAVDLGDPGLRVYDKLDGTLIILYWDALKDKWCTATRGVPEADVPMLGFGQMTFADLYRAALTNTICYSPINEGHIAERHNAFYNSVNKRITYMLELTSPHNRVVVQYYDTKLTMLGARHLDDGQECDLDVLVHGIPQCKFNTYYNMSLVALAAKVNALKPSDNEGVVLCDSKFRRLKMKSDAYVLSHRFKDALTVSRRDVLLSVCDGTIDDVVQVLEKSLVVHVDDLRSKLASFTKEIDAACARFVAEANGDRKAFALLVNESGLWHPPFFDIFSGKVGGAFDYLETRAKNGKLTKSSLDAVIDRIGWAPNVNPTAD